MVVQEEGKRTKHRSFRSSFMLEQQKMQNDIKEAFGLLDVDGSGTVSSSELTVMLAALGIEMTELEVRDMVAEVDKDRSGEIDFNEFVILVTKYIAQGTDEIRETFDAIDANHDGKLTYEEFTAGLKAAGLSIDADDLNQMFMQADLDNSGAMDFYEFRTAYTQHGWGKVRGLSKCLQELRHTWDLLDSDKNGHVDLDEVVDLFKRVGQEVTFEEVQEMFEQADDNGDNRIDYEEFVKVYQSKGWLKAKHIGMARAQLLAFRDGQSQMYLDMQKQEREETGLAAVDKTVLMERRALRNDRKVIDAIQTFWQMLGDLKVDDKWITKGVYLTYHTKIFSVLEQSRYFVASSAKEVAEEDWLCDEAKEREYWESAKVQAAMDMKAMDTNKDGVVSQEEFSAAGHTDAEFEHFDANQDGALDAAEMDTRADQLTIIAGTPPPEGLACIGYAGFFESIYELIDVKVGMEQGNVNAQAYADMCKYLQDSILKVEYVDGEDGSESTVQCSWVDADNVYCDAQWGTNDEPTQKEESGTKSDLDEFLGHCLDQQVASFGGLSEVARATTIASMPAAAKANLFTRLSDDQQLHMINTMTIDDQATLFALSSSTEGQAAVLAALSPEDKAALFRALSPEDKAAMLAALSAADRAALFRALSPEGKAAMLAPLSTEDRAALFTLLSSDDKAAMIAAVCPADRLGLFALLSPKDKAAMLAAMPSDDRAVLFRGSTRDDKAAMLAALSPADRALLFVSLSTEEREEMMAIMTAKDIVEISTLMSLEERFTMIRLLDDQTRASVFELLRPEDWALVFASLPVEHHASLFSLLTTQKDRKLLVSALTPEDRVRLYVLFDHQNQMQMLSMMDSEEVANMFPLMPDEYCPLLLSHLSSTEQARVLMSLSSEDRHTFISNLNTQTQAKLFAVLAHKYRGCMVLEMSDQDCNAMAQHLPPELHAELLVLMNSSLLTKMKARQENRGQKIHNAFPDSKLCSGERMQFCLPKIELKEDNVLHVPPPESRQNPRWMQEHLPATEHSLSRVFAVFPSCQVPAVTRDMVWLQAQDSFVKCVPDGFGVKRGRLLQPNPSPERKTHPYRIKRTMHAAPGRPHMRCPPRPERIAGTPIKMHPEGRPDRFSHGSLSRGVSHTPMPYYGSSQSPCSSSFPPLSRARRVDHEIKNVKYRIPRSQSVMENTWTPLPNPNYQTREFDNVVLENANAMSAWPHNHEKSLNVPRHPWLATPAGVF